jgi:hypothetical protein
MLGAEFLAHEVGLTLEISLRSLSSMFALVERLHCRAALGGLEHIEDIPDHDFTPVNLFASYITLTSLTGIVLVLSTACSTTPLLLALLCMDQYKNL